MAQILTDIVTARLLIFVPWRRWNYSLPLQSFIAADEEHIPNPAEDGRVKLPYSVLGDPKKQAPARMNI